MEKPRMERSAKRVRAFVGGVPVLDTTRAWLVWERPWAPVYWYPPDDVAPGHLDRARRSDPAGGEVPEGHVSFAWDDVDAWFEEDEELVAHVRDPYHRVDILASSRHVVVEVDGVEVASSTHAHALFETGLPTRWYLPKVDVRMDLLTPTDSRTYCPYKGEATYWSVRVGDRAHDDLVWTYRAPLPESQKIAGKLAFYDEKVDVTIDGVRQERPRTKFA